MARRFEQAEPQTTVDALSATDPVYADSPLSTDGFVALRILFKTCTAAGLGFANDF